MMLCLLLIGSMLFASSTGPKSVSSKSRSAVSKQKINYITEVEDVPAAQAPQYNSASIEYKIQQIALNIESVLPSKIINPEYKDLYLDTAGVPKDMRDNFMSRNVLYNDIIKIKVMDKAKENTNGLLDATPNASTEDNEKIQSENTLRAELFLLIVRHLDIKNEQDKLKVPNIYAEALKYLKDYSLNTQQQPQKKDLWFITSITTIYKFDAVWETLLKVLKEEEYLLEKNAANKSKGTISVKYKCAQEERAFDLRVCALKEDKLYNCRGIKDDDVTTKVVNGTVIWVQKGADKDRTLIVSEEILGDQNIRLCKDDNRVFDVLERLSSILIEADKSNEKAKKN